MILSFRPLSQDRPAAAQRGFTVPELLVVLVVSIGLIALSLWIAHPKDFTPANNNAARWTDAAQLMQALHRYKADIGSVPAGLPQDEKVIGNAKDEVDLCKALVPKYLKDMPLDPTDGAQYAVVDCRGVASNPGKYVTGYTVRQAPDGTVTIAAPHGEHNQTIRLSQKL